MVEYRWTRRTSAIFSLRGMLSFFHFLDLSLTTLDRSGTTGNPKAVSLTHHNLLNNGLVVGDCMNLQRPSADFAGEKLANIPPMFHCFGIVLGNLAVWSHGGCIVFPAYVNPLPQSNAAIDDLYATGRRSTQPPRSEQ